MVLFQAKKDRLNAPWWSGLEKVYKRQGLLWMREINLWGVIRQGAMMAEGNHSMRSIMTEASMMAEGN